MQDMNRELAQMLQGHGVEVEVADGWVKPVRQGPPARAFLVHNSSEGDRQIVSLEVHWALEDGRVIRESYAGFAADFETAAREALIYFSTTALHVVLNGLYGEAQPEQVDEEHWERAGVQWRAMQGPAAFRSFKGEEGSDPETPSLPDAFAETLQSTWLEACPRDGRPHWLRVFVCHLENNLTCEAHLDNEPWPLLSDRMRQLPWGMGGEFYTVRNFHLILPSVARRVTSPRFTGPLQLEAELRYLLETLTRLPEIDDEALFDLLTGRGLEPALANQLLVFAPVGFSTTLLQGAELPTNYSLMGEENQIVGEYPLTGEPVFSMARAMASVLAASDETRNQLYPLAARCSLFNAANKALHAHEDGKLEDLEFTSLMVSIDARPSSPPVRKPRPKPSRPQPGQGGGAATAKRPWWKLW